ncbi:MAG: hypothetical protein JF887_01720 [Candidatus Dormibacteraeota bacterium]|uniref:DUF1211 domain-containing protein n=1 Tax=Candidatus Amunia macphersoniae TaxID=3127014 RepID=A0A934NF47_9BACT|nr:hypothetical protein [Candidatus Dormibacteraeota bacterium]
MTEHRSGGMGSATIAVDEEPKSGETDRHRQRSGQIAAHHVRRFRDVTNGIFGLIVVLSGFALTEVPVRVPYDMVNIVCYFLPIFLFVVYLWRQVGELLDVHPSHDRRLTQILTVCLFFATLVPVAVRLSVVGEGGVRTYAPVGVSFIVAAVFLLLALCAHRAARVHTEVTHPKDTRFLRQLALSDLLTALMFMASAALDAEASVLRVPLQSAVWVAAFFVPNILWGVQARLRRAA